MYIAAAFFLMQFWPGERPKELGREGNAFYEQGSYSEAAASYSRGLMMLGPKEFPSELTAALMNNLGASLYRRQVFDSASVAFARALSAAPSAEDSSRIAYNAGNVFFKQQQLDASLENYRAALLADPSNQDARYNFEFVKRRKQKQEQEQQRQQQQQQQNQQNQDQQGEGEQQQDSSGQNQQQQQQNGRQNQQSQQGNNQERSHQNQGRQQQQQGADGEQASTPQQAAPGDPAQMSRRQALRILQALQQQERQLLREVITPEPSTSGRVEKDW